MLYDQLTEAQKNEWAEGFRFLQISRQNGSDNKINCNALIQSRTTIGGSMQITQSLSALIESEGNVTKMLKHLLELMGYNPMNLPMLDQESLVALGLLAKDGNVTKAEYENAVEASPMFTLHVQSIAFHKVERNEWSPYPLRIIITMQGGLYSSEVSPKLFLEKMGEDSVQSLLKFICDLTDLTKNTDI